MDEFNSEEISLDFDGDKVSFKLPSHLFAKFETQELEDATVVTVTKLFKKDELEKLEITKTKGHGSKLQIIITDKAAVSSDVENFVKLQLGGKKLFGWRSIFKGDVPAENLTITDDKIIINVGELDLNLKYIKRKKKIRYTLWIGRKFVDNTTTVKLKKGKIKLR